jgi:hypothetical protein
MIKKRIIRCLDEPLDLQPILNLATLSGWRLDVLQDTKHMFTKYLMRLIALPSGVDQHESD